MEGVHFVFYDVFCSLCEKNGLTPGGAASKIGFNRASITVWKNSGKAPKQELLTKIASFFNVTTDYLLGLEDLKERAPAPEGERKPKKEELMAAFWGGDKDLSPEDMDAMWRDVENFAAFVAQKKKEEKRQ